MLDVRKAIKHLMIDQDLKSRELAERLDLKPKNFSNWLYKPDDPRLSTIEKILGELGCHLAIVDDKSGEILF